MYNWCKCLGSACLEVSNSLASVHRVGLHCPDFDIKKIDNYSVTGNFRTMLNIAALMDNKIRQINRVSNIPF